MTPARRPAPWRVFENIASAAAADVGWSDLLTGDLREEFDAIAHRRGAAVAHAWYALQTGVAVAARLFRSTRQSARALFRPQGDRLMTTLVRDTRIALRALVREPLVTGIVLVTLALCLGANAATFGMIDSLLLRPFTIKDVDRLILISENSTADPFPQESVSPGNFTDFRRQTTTLDGIAAFRWWDVNLAGSDQPERVEGFAVTGDFFRLLGVSPALGRLLDEQDMTYGSHQRVVLSDGLWKRRFGADANVVGRSVTLDGVPYTIVGVAPAAFSFPNGAELWSAFDLKPEEAANRVDHYITVFGRLQPGVSRDRAAAELETIYARIKTDHADATRGRHMIVRSFTEGMVDVGMPQILMLWQAAAALVLLIGCTNIANLLLARGAARQREIAVRLAIGAGRLQLMRQLFVESVVLALLAIPLAIGVAAAALALCKSFMPGELVRFVAGWTSMGVNARVLVFTGLAALITAVVFGLLPAVQASRPVLVAALRDGGRSNSGAAGRSVMRRGLVVAEIALALPLLIASGLAAIGAQRFATGPQGYDPDGLFRAQLILDEVRYPDEGARRQFTERLVDEVRRQPGVTMAGTTSSLPASGTNQARSLAIEGRAPDPDNDLTVNYRAITPGYLATLRVPLLHGRSLTSTDVPGSEPVALVSQSAADAYWPGESALGKRIRIGDGDRPWTTIVGVVGNTIDDWFNRRGAPTVYVPVAQMPSARVNLVLRTDRDPGTMLEAARAAVAAVDPSQPLFEAMTMRDAIYLRTTGLRFIGGLMAVFGALALVLASIGIYSVMAFYVAQRRHEMGIRVALGASRADVLRLTVGHGARMAAVGIVIGLGLGAALAQALESVMFGVGAVEPWLFAVIAITLAAVALVASLIPARHAAAVDPIRALRAE